MTKKTAAWTIIVIIMLMAASLASGVYVQTEKEIAIMEDHKPSLVKNPIFRIVAFLGGMDKSQAKRVIAVPNNEQ